MKRLKSFHNRALRHLTGHHICKRRDNTWEYPKHDELLKLAKLLPIEKYIERRRGTLLKYLTANRRELLEEAKKTKKHCYDSTKVLWWQQPCLE